MDYMYREGGREAEKEEEENLEETCA